MRSSAVRFDYQVKDDPKMTSADANPVALLDVSRGNKPLRDEILSAIAKVYDSGRFLYGPAVQELEQRVAEASGTTHAVGCASGSDALLLALMANDVGPGDEVIVPSFTFFATASCVARLGATIVFADIDPRTYNLCPESLRSSITQRTAAIIPVHLFGQPAAMDKICSIAAEKEIPVIEDSAQALGAAYHGRPVGSWGQCGCISFYPTKNLGGIGDGGMLSTNSESFADRLRLCSSHGMRPRYYHSMIGINSRLDTIQAAALAVKMKHLAAYTSQRQRNAANYASLFDELKINQQAISLPSVDPAANHVWNQYSLRVHDGKRDELREFLSSRQIGTEIYYPIPLHLQECFKYCGYPEGSLPNSEKASDEILHLPIYPELTIAEQKTVVAAISEFCAVRRSKSAA